MNAEIRPLKVNVHGGGYVGLTGAAHYHKAGLAVVITDPDLAVVNAINKGQPKAGSFLHYTDIPQLSDRWMAQPIPDLGADVHIIAVPSERNDEPFMDIVLDVFKMLDERAHPQIPIIVESTVMPGVAAKLRALANYALKPRPWAIAPRRDWFADKDKNLSTLTRVVGRDHQHATSIDGWITAVCRDVQWTTPETAEVTKALENALLHLPVVLLHELALNFPDYDITEAARLASSHWRFKSLGPLYLGLGTGGRCVPLGSRYLSERGGALLQTAIEVDDDFAWEVICSIVSARWDPDGIHSALSLRAETKTKSAVVLGVAYRPGFKDAGHSPGVRVIDSLAQFFGTVTVCDPYFTREEILGLIDNSPDQRSWGNPDDSPYADTQFIPCSNGPELLQALGEADMIVVTVAHEEFKRIGVPGALKDGAVLLDGPGIWDDPALWDALRALPKEPNIRYLRPGRPGWLRQ